MREAQVLFQRGGVGLPIQKTYHLLFIRGIGDQAGLPVILIDVAGNQQNILLQRTGFIPGQHHPQKRGGILMIQGRTVQSRAEMPICYILNIVL